jgi:hypothetical protein
VPIYKYRVFKNNEVINMPDISDVLKKGAKAVGKEINKGLDITEKRARLSLYIKGVLKTPGHLQAVVDNAKRERQILKRDEKRAFAKFKKNTDMILNGLNGVSKVTFDGVGKLMGEVMNTGLRFFGPDEYTKVYRNAAKAGTRAVAKAVHGLTYASLSGIRNTTGKMYVRAATKGQRRNYKAAKAAAIASM